MELTMKITPNILSIPPYISTSWKNIVSLHVDIQQSSSPSLVINLSNGAHISIPHLDPNSIEMIFAAHAKYLEMDEAPPKQSIPSTSGQIAKDLGLPSVGFPIDSSLNPDNMGAALQHNPDQADAPDLPSSMIEKITMLSKTVGITDPNMIPQPEPHCNCTHCQIARALQAGIEEGSREEGTDSQEEEEIVSEEDLKFRTWDIHQTGDKLFIVQNPLDSKEHYSVYLGEPIGCTCGEKHCEHVRAVLSS